MVKVPRLLRSDADFSGHGPYKLDFHIKAKVVMKHLAKVLGLQTQDYTIRSNLGGPAVSGEVTLHSQYLYVQVHQSFGGLKVLYRSCEGLKDYTGGPNNYAKISDLEDRPALIAQMKAMINQKRTELQAA